MKTIDWSRFNSDIFTHFCNALLSFELGNKFVPFSAPGKDGGIDGQMIKDNDHWRFQYKFKTTPTKTALSSLKSDLKNESSKLTSDVSHYFLLTNVELLPSSIAELTSLWYEITGGNVLFEIWDGAKLNTKIIAYPLLRLWLDEGFDTAQLTNYRDYFSSQLANKDPLSPVSLTNYYVKNQSLENALFEFIKSDKIVFNLVGEAGLGKTRAILEFFKVLETLNERWILLVLNSHSINYDSVNYAISGDTNHIILVDDAHTFEDNIIYDLFSLVSKKRDKAKLIMTSRQKGINTTDLPLKEFNLDFVWNYQINALSISDTKSFFLHYLTTSTFKAFIDELVHFSYGKPIVIVAMINAIKNKKEITQLRNDNFLKKYVTNHFNDFISKINLEFNFSKNKILNVISVLALIEPINIHDSDELKQIAQVTGVDVEEVEEIIFYLKNRGVFDGKSSISIKPDLYSDILVSNIESRKLTKYIEYFKNKINNILINLSSSISNNEAEEVLKALSDVYLNSVNFVSNKFNFLDISSTIFKIGGHFPEITKGLITIYIKRLADTKSVFFQELEQLNQNKDSQSAISSIIITNISNHLSSLLINKENYSFVFNAIFEIQDKYNISSILGSIYSFTKVDYYDGFKMERQIDFLHRVKFKEKLLNENETFLLIQVFSSFMKLEFMTTESSIDRKSVSMTTYMVPENENVRLVREKVIENLLNLFQKKNVDYRLTILKILIDIAREIFSNYKNLPHYDGEKEVSKILSFLALDSTEFSSSEKFFLNDQLRFFRFWDKKHQHVDQLQNIKNKLLATSLVEELVHILSRNFDLDRSKSYDEVRKEVSKRISELLTKENPSEIANSLIQAYELKGNKFINLYVFTQQLILKDDNFLMEFYDVLKNGVDTFLFSRIAPDILQKLRNNNSALKIYISLVTNLLELEDSQMDNVFLSIFSSSTDIYSKEIFDFEITFLEKILIKKSEKNGYQIAEMIPTIMAYDPTLGTRVTLDFFEHCHQSHAEYTFMYLNRFNSNYNLTRNLLLQHSLRFSISYEFEMVMNIILRNEGCKVIMDYFDKRFLRLVNILKTKKVYDSYVFVPANNSSALFEDLEHLRPVLFKHAVDWFLSLKDSTVLYFAKSLFEYLADSKELAPALAKVINDLADYYKSNYEIQNRLLTVLQEFIAQDERFIDLILRIFENANSVKTENDSLEDLMSNAYVALTNTGVKIGTPGEPFSQDIILMEILRRKISNYSVFSNTYELLNNAIKSIQSSIDRSNDNIFNNETWV